MLGGLRDWVGGKGALKTKTTYIARKVLQSISSKINNFDFLPKFCLKCLRVKNSFYLLSHNILGNKNKQIWASFWPLCLLAM